MDIIINLIGIALFVAVILWFWVMPTRSSSAVVSENEIIDIQVEDGVYKPSSIQVDVGKPITLRFIRKDSSPCASIVIFDGLDLSQELPINQSEDIKLTVSQSGEYKFSCQMGMYQGVLVAK